MSNVTIKIPADALALAVAKVEEAEPLAVTGVTSFHRRALYEEAHTLAVLAHAMMIGRMRA